MEQLAKVSGKMVDKLNQINKMKKLSLYVFLVLIFCNVGFAEQIIIKCLGAHIYEGDKKKWNNWKRTIQVDFIERGTRDHGLEGFTGDFSNIIITDDYFLMEKIYFASVSV